MRSTAMKSLIIGVLALALLPTLALAQQGSDPAGAQVVSGCGTPATTYTAGQIKPVTQDTNGYGCANVSVSGGGVSASAPTNTSATITTGGTFQTIQASSATRKSLEFMNVCAKSGNCTAITNNCYLYIAASGSPTTANAVVVPAGGYYLRSVGNIPSSAIQATCDGTGDHFYLAVQ